MCIVLLIAGCDANSPQRDAPDRGEGEPAIGDFSPSAIYGVAYDETKYVYSYRWPKQLVKAGKQTSGDKYITSYSSIGYRTEYDENGYMSQSYEYLDGNAQTRLPKEARKKIGDRRPAYSADSDPVVRMEMSDGQMRYYGVSGAELRSVSYDPETFRVDPEDLAAAGYDTTANADERRSNARAQLRRQGLSFSIVDEGHVEVNRNATDGSVTQIISLDINRPVLQTFYGSGGKKDMVMRHVYRVTNGVPVEIYREADHYANLNGQWQPVKRTVRERDNVRALKRQ